MGRPASPERTIKRLQKTVEQLRASKLALSGALHEVAAELDQAKEQRDEFVRRFRMVAQDHAAAADALQVRGKQLDAVVTHLDALAERYVGVKLDTQQFTFPQAREWLNGERNLVRKTLDRISDEAQRNRCQTMSVQADQDREAA